MIQHRMALVLMPADVKPYFLLKTLEGLLGSHKEAKRFRDWEVGGVFDGLIFGKRLNPNQSLCRTHQQFAMNRRPMKDLPESFVPDVIVTPQGEWVVALDDPAKWKEAIKRAKKKFSAYTAYTIDLES